MTDAGKEPRARRHVNYTGHVQGVCFRATTDEIAARYEVTGYVRNLRDGSVELEAEGPLSELQAFLAEIQRHFEQNIKQTQTKELPLRGVETDFHIRYY